jgi:NAD(P)-dependent dehydrogenase (short-subunit alcohol dehydrogenase family)
MAETEMTGVILVTGGTRGIGAATALLAAEHGYDVVATYDSNETAARTLEEGVRARGRRVLVRAGRLNSPEFVRTIFNETMEQLGPISAVVNNAGYAGNITRFEDLDLSILREVLEVNIVGTFMVAQEAVRRMSTKRGGNGGAIVNVSSLGAKTGSPGELVHYAASKAAIETFTYGLAAEVAQEGIRINCVSPGLIETEMHAAMGDADRLRRYATRMPMARPGKPGEIAEAIIWLLSTKASYVTGATLPVGGGR